MKVLVTGGSGFIGTHLVELLLARGDEVVNLSLGEPPVAAHLPLFRKVDVLDPRALAANVTASAPELVFHLAARTEMDESTTPEVGFRANTEGTRNVLEAVRAAGSVRRFVLCSSQFVCGPGRLPRGDEDFFPATVYGQSKVIAEQETRRAKLPCDWVITRPTNVWGPHHPRYPREFWRIAARGLYVHPGRRPVIRSYGYVRNVVAQMAALADRPAADVAGKVFYVGDAPIDVRRWADAFCVALRGKPAPTVPRLGLRAAAALGDLISRATGRPFYISSSRYRSMVSDYPTPMDRTFALLGAPSVGLEEGVRETVAWLRGEELALR